MRPKIPSSPPRVAALLAAMTASTGLLFTHSAYAADINWSPSAADTSWAADINWSGGTAPANDPTSDTAVFNSTSAYANQPTLDAFTTRSINGIRIGGPASVAVNIGTGTGTLATFGNTAAESDTLVMADVTGLAVGQQVSGNRINAGTFITAIDTATNTITLSRPVSGGTLNGGTELTFRSTLRLGDGGITAVAGSSHDNHTISAPIFLASDQTWANESTRRLNVQGSIYLDDNTLTLIGVAGSTISFNGSQGGSATDRQSIGGSGNIVIETDGTVNFGSGSNNRMQSSFTGGVTLNKGTLELQGGNAGGGGGMGGLGTGVLTINGGTIKGNGNIAGKPLTISGQVWNADWDFVGSKSVDMGVGDISLGTASGTSRTVTTTASLPLIIGGAISDGATANTFIKAGTGALHLAGINTYTGNTIVTEGELTLTSTGALTFYIGESGVNNRVEGAGTFIAEGVFIFDLSNASETGIWTIVDTLSTSFTSTFMVQDFEEDPENEGIWRSGIYTFNQNSGVLSAIPEPSTYALLAGAGVLVLGVIRRRRAART